MLNQKIKVVDARMGRGKTSAAIQYIFDNKAKRYVYVTPYLSEVDRICNACDFEQPDASEKSKLSDFKEMLIKNRNIATTHSLMSLAGDDVLEIIEDKHYTLIIDESIDVIRRRTISDGDYKILLDNYLDSPDPTGRVRWKDPSYSGVYSKIKDLADSGAMFKQGKELISIIKPEFLTAFDEVIIMTYMFEGQYLQAYLKLFGLEYVKCGVDTTYGFRLTDRPDAPPVVDYRSLIHIINDTRLNLVGRKDTALSLNWYNYRGRNHDDIVALRGAMNKIFERSGEHIPADRQLWTSFKNAEAKLLGPKRRYCSSFLQLNAKATNKYSDRDVVLYLVNRFVDPTLRDFFESRGVMIDEEQFALQEMLQFIWRSAIRQGKPITLYVPSSRMRRLLIRWIEENSPEKGEPSDAA